MSEYWKSTPKYWCKHCSTYVKDTPFERKQHENTGKHQGNLKRFLRGIQNDHEKEEREKGKAKAEIDRLNRVVGGSTSSVESSISKSKTSHKTSAAPLTALDQKRQWAQLAEMGIQVPENFRAEMAMPGQWQTVSEAVEKPPTIEDTLSLGVRKRKLNEHEEEEEEEAHQPGNRRGWGSTTRRYPGQDESDLDALLSEALVKTENSQKPAVKPKAIDSPTVENKSALSLETNDDIPQSVSNEVEVKLGQNSRDDEPQAKRETKEADEKDTLGGIPHAPPTSVFKKRKMRSKAGKETN